MRKKNKKKIIICVLALIVIVLVIVLIIAISKKGNKEPEINPNDQVENVYELPDTTYTGMEVKDVSLEYLSENNETMVTFTITNTTDRVVSKESLTAYLLNKEGKIIGQLPTYIDSLAKDEQNNISVILKGDLTSTTEISLQQNDSSKTEQNNPENNQ